VGTPKRGGTFSPCFPANRFVTVRMKNRDSNPSKELYRRLRKLSAERLWTEEVPKFNRATQRERVEQVALVRAVSVVLSESGTEGQRRLVRPWLLNLLQDPDEKIRRYAMAALPKFCAGPGEETELLSLLRTTGSDREKKYLARTLEKVGGSATLETLAGGAEGLSRQTEQKIRASVARNQSPSRLCSHRVISQIDGIRIHLRGRRGLENIVRDEIKGSSRSKDKFRIEEVSAGLVALTPLSPFSLNDIYALRCFGTVGFVLATVDASEAAGMAEAVPNAITSPLSRRLLQTFTEGSIRYRLDFVAHGHQRGAIRQMTERAYALCPDILNDPRQAPWVVAVHPGRQGNLVELSPRFSPDPRFSYRQHDVPAASHPQLAASMARIAGPMKGEIIWDPFCGSGLELVERSLLGGVHHVYGTDLSLEAIQIAWDNLRAANIQSLKSTLLCRDFRDLDGVTGLGPNSVTLVITNPPMGKRVPIPDLPGLIKDLFLAAEKVLKPGGRLVFANPLPLVNPARSLKLQSAQVVDFGGFDCQLEKYIKSSR
jgi:23S rRNA G2445 N2-methylase RlmL